jgi:hypothetical protein
MSPAPKLPPATSSPSSAPAQPGRRPGANLLVALLILAAVTLLILEWLGVLPLGAALATGYQWLILLGGVALLLGVVNVAAMHLWRIQTGQRDWVLSLVLLAVLLAVLTAGVISPAGASAPPLDWVFDAVVAPGQASLFALLVFFMAAAAFRYLRLDRPGGPWMLAGALLVLLAQWPLLAQWLPPTFAAVVFWLLDGPVMAALRGLLLGSGIALLVIGLRLLLGRA